VQGQMVASISNNTSSYPCYGEFALVRCFCAMPSGLVLLRLALPLLRVPFAGELGETALVWVCHEISVRLR